MSERASYTLNDARKFTAQARDSGARPRVHPNGFIQLDLMPEELPAEASERQWDSSKHKGHSGASLRLHVWNPPGIELPHQETVNEIHDHVFDMHSHVVRGVLLQKLYWFVIGNEGPDTHELYRAVYDQRSFSRLAGTGVLGQLRWVHTMGVGDGQSYMQPAFTLHDTEAQKTVVTVMKKTKIHDGIPSVICAVDTPPDNDYDRATAASQDVLWEAIERSLS